MTNREKQRTDLILKYEKILSTEENSDTEPWSCKVCGCAGLTRMFAIIEHCLAHVRRDELEAPEQRPAPARAEKLVPGGRALELE